MMLIKILAWLTIRQLKRKLPWREVDKLERQNLSKVPLAVAMNEMYKDLYGKAGLANPRKLRWIGRYYQKRARQTTLPQSGPPLMITLPVITQPSEVSWWTKAVVLVLLLFLILSVLTWLGVRPNAIAAVIQDGKGLVNRVGKVFEVTATLTTSPGSSPAINKVGKTTLTAMASGVTQLATESLTATQAPVLLESPEPEVNNPTVEPSVQTDEPTTEKSSPKTVVLTETPMDVVITKTGMTTETPAPKPTSTPLSAIQQTGTATPTESSTITPTPSPTPKQVHVVELGGSPTPILPVPVATPVSVEVTAEVVSTETVIVSAQEQIESVTTESSQTEMALAETSTVTETDKTGMTTETPAPNPTSTPLSAIQQTGTATPTESSTITPTPSPTPKQVHVVELGGSPTPILPVPVATPVSVEVTAEVVSTPAAASTVPVTATTQAEHSVTPEFSEPTLIPVATASSLPIQTFVPLPTKTPTPILTITPSTKITVRGFWEVFAGGKGQGGVRGYQAQAKNHLLPRLDDKNFIVQPLNSEGDSKEERITFPDYLDRQFEIAQKTFEEKGQANELKALQDFEGMLEALVEDNEEVARMYANSLGAYIGEVDYLPSSFVDEYINQFFPKPCCTVKPKSLNLRSGPGTAYESLKSLTRNKKVTPLAFSLLGYPKAEWVKVELQNGQQGWVHADFVSCNIKLHNLPGSEKIPETPTPTNTPTLTPTPTPTKTPTPTPTPTPTLWPRER